MVHSHPCLSFTVMLGMVAGTIGFEKRVEK